MTTADTPPPSSVRRAVLCLWISAGLALLVTIAQLTGLAETVGASASSTAVIGVITAALLALVAVNLTNGKGWARWVFAVIYAIGTSGSVVLALLAPEMFRALPTFLQANTATQFILQTAALVLVFASTSRPWFRSQRDAAAP